jgi:hypothetical protein
MGVAPNEERLAAGPGLETRVRARTWPWWIAVGAAAVALALREGAGVDLSLGFLRLSAHNPRPPAILAAAIVLVCLVTRRRLTWTADLPALADDVRARAQPIAIAIALAAVVFAIVWNTWTIGGSDSHCYAAQARTFASGRIHMREPLALTAPWPDATRTLAPVGFLPSASTPGEFIPICAPGYSALLVPLVIVSPVLQFFVAPLSAAVTILATVRLARGLDDDPITGVAAGLLVASTPIVLYQAVQPMIDLPTAAAVAAAAALMWAAPARPAAAGASLGLALLWRPNLLPIVIPFLMPIFSRHSRRDSAAFWLALAPIAAMVPVLNTLVYGAPWRSGYGDTAALFSLAFVPTNATRYFTWAIETMPALIIGVAAPAIAARASANGSPRATSWRLLALAAAVVACYLAYRPFDDWWYLRFLLPAVAPLCALTAVVIVRLSSPARRYTGLAALVIVAAVAWHGLDVARTRAAFDLWRIEQRLSDTAKYLKANIPDAVAIAIQPNGAIRYELDRPVVSWDSLEPQWLDRAIAWIASRGGRPLLVVDGTEIEGFRRRFGGISRYGPLDWPPRAIVHHAVTVYDPADRSRYLAGEHRLPERVDPPSRSLRR